MHVHVSQVSNIEHWTPLDSKWEVIVNPVRWMDTGHYLYYTVRKMCLCLYTIEAPEPKMYGS